MRYVLPFLILCCICAPSSAKSKLGYGDAGSLRPYSGRHHSIRLIREKIKLEFLSNGQCAFLVDYQFKNEGAAQTVPICLPVDTLGQRSKEGELADLSLQVSGHPFSFRREELSSVESERLGYDVLWVAQISFERYETQHLRVRYRSSEHGSCADFLYYMLSDGLWRGRVSETSLMIVNGKPSAGDSATYLDTSAPHPGREIKFVQRGHNLYARWTNWNPIGGFEVD